MVLVLKKEVVRTSNSVEHDDTGKYRQLLVRILHQCSVKFPDVASTVIPVVSIGVVFVKTCSCIALCLWNQIKSRNELL